MNQNLSNKLAAIVSPGGGGGSGGITNPLLGNTLQGYLQGGQSETALSRILANLITLALIIGVLYFMYQLLMGGINWIMSRGDKVNVENARNRVTHALLGVIILFSVFAIMSVVESFFGINLMNIDLAPLYIQ